MACVSTPHKKRHRTGVTSTTATENLHLATRATGKPCRVWYKGSKRFLINTWFVTSRVIGLCTLCWLFAPLAGYAEKPIDANGWLNVSWGMNENELLALNWGVVRSPRKLELSNGESATLHVPRLKIGGLLFHVFFVTDPHSGTLEEMRIQPVSAQNSDVSFQKLKELLSRDLGTPRAERDNEESSAASWLLPSTVARLTRTKMKTSDFELGVPNLYTTELSIRANESRSHLPFGAAWNMSPAAARKLTPAIESASETGATKVLTAIGDFKGQKAKLDFTFISDRLYSITYRFTTNHPDRNEFITQYNQMAEALKETFGSPVKTETLWRDKLFANDQRSWGLAVSRGDLAMNSTWHDNDSSVLLHLGGENLHVGLTLTFTSRALDLISDLSH